MFRSREGRATIARDRISAVLLVRFVLAACYSTVPRAELLDNPVRARIVEVVRARPGVSIADIAEAAGVRHQTVTYHIALLEKHDLLREQQVGNRRCQFLNGATRSDVDRRLMILSRDQLAMRTVKTLKETGAISKKRLARLLGISRTTSAWHLHKLVSSGVVVIEKRDDASMIHLVPERLDALLAHAQGE